MSNLINLVLLYGGKSGEHEVSLMSAASVLTHLDPERYRITPIGMDQDGRLFVNDYNTLRAFPEALPVMTDTSVPLDSLLSQGQFALDADVVFPVVHGPIYEDGCFQGLLELSGVAYVGCGVLSSAMGMDKDIARRIACVDGIQSTRYRRLPWYVKHDNLEAFCKETALGLGWPLFVKPCSLGSSVGIHKASTLTELMEAISDARRYDDEVLIEAFIEGREIELAVLENITPGAAPKVSFPGEICVHHQDGFYSYTAKYLESNHTDLTVPAHLDDGITGRLQQMAADIFTRLKCQGMARVDFFVDDVRGDIYFNEINTLPGFTCISMYPKMWAASGIPYSTLLDQLVDLAMMRRRNKNLLVTHYQ